MEGEEFDSLPQMLASNVFENIQQMHLEATLIWYKTGYKSLDDLLQINFTVYLGTHW